MKLDRYNLNVTHEAISYQVNDKFVIDAIEIYKAILEDIDGLNISSDRMFRRKIVKEKIDELDILILKRFGLQTQHVFGSNSTYGIITIPPKGYNVLIGDVNKQIEQIESYKDLHPSTCETPSCVANINDVGALVNNISISYKSLAEVMNVNGIVVDEEKVKITGLPSTYTLFTVTDLSILSKLNLTPREVVAILLHEIGHAFTHISESTKSVKFVGTLVDAIHETKDMPPKVRKKLIAKKVFGKTLEAENETTYLIEFHKNMLSEITMNNYDVQSSVESERMADQFTVRFGMAGDIASGLEKHYKPASNVSYNDAMRTSLKVGLVFMGVFGIVIVTKVVLFAILLVALNMSLWFILLGVMLGGESTRIKTYDGRKQRLIRIVNEEIHLLRIYPDKRLHEEKVKTIRFINSVIKTLDDDMKWFKPFESLWWHRKTKNETELVRELEAGINNILHVSLAQHRL